MTGLLAFVGGDEHLPGCETIDAHLLESVLHADPTVVVLAYASSPRKRPGAEDRARRWWRAMDIDIVTPDLDDPAEVIEAVGRADIIILTGGVPNRLAHRLRGSAVWRAIIARHLQGAHLSGSSAGSMLLAGVRQSVLPPFRMAPGLGILDNTAVAPHHDMRVIRMIAWARVRTHPDLLIVGIDERTALVGTNGRYRVMGEGRVAVRLGRTTRYHAVGDMVDLPATAIVLPDVDPGTAPGLGPLSA